VNTRQRLMEVGGRLFAESGFDSVSVREITREAGANLGAITYHFGSKAELFRTILVEKIQPLREIGMRVQQSEASPRGKLSQLLLESMLHILHHDPHLKALFAEAIHGGERLPEEAIQSLVERNRLIAGLIREGVERGDFQPCDVESATWTFFGMLVPYVLHQPLITPERRLGPYPEPFVREVVATALKLYFDGLEKS